MFSSSKLISLESTKNPSPTSIDLYTNFQFASGLNNPQLTCFDITVIETTPRLKLIYILQKQKNNSTNVHIYAGQHTRDAIFCKINCTIAEVPNTRNTRHMEL